jgi:hypothetical protein
MGTTSPKETKWQFFKKPPLRVLLYFSNFWRPSPEKKKLLRWYLKKCDGRCARGLLLSRQQWSTGHQSFRFQDNVAQIKSYVRNICGVFASIFL